MPPKLLTRLYREWGPLHIDLMLLHHPGKMMYTPIKAMEQAAADGENTLCRVVKLVCGGTDRVPAASESHPFHWCKMKYIPITRKMM